MHESSWGRSMLRAHCTHLWQLLRLDLSVVTSFFAASSSLSLSLILFCRLRRTTAAAQTQSAQQLQSSSQRVVAAAQAAAEATYLSNSKARPPSPAFPGLCIPWPVVKVQLRRLCEDSSP